MDHSGGGVGGVLHINSLAIYIFKSWNSFAIRTEIITSETFIFFGEDFSVRIWDAIT